MFSDISTYFWALVCNWAGVIWAADFVLLVVGLMLRREQYDRLATFLDGYIEEPNRVAFLRGLLVVALVISGFLAWDDQYRIAITKTPAAIDGRISSLEGKYDSLDATVQTLSSNFRTFVKGTAERIPDQAQGVEALRKQVFKLAFNILSFVTTTETDLPQIPQHPAPDLTAEYQRHQNDYLFGQQINFEKLYKPQIQTLLEHLKANGVHLDHPDSFYTDPRNLDEMRLGATDLTVAANRLPAR
jgi:hypothetical protein